MNKRQTMKIHGRGCGISCLYDLRTSVSVFPLKEVSAPFRVGSASLEYIRSAAGQTALSALSYTRYSRSMIPRYGIRQDGRKLSCVFQGRHMPSTMRAIRGDAEVVKQRRCFHISKTPTDTGSEGLDATFNFQY